MLYIIPTPIGNLKDLTFRALEVLQAVDSIICEDTRRASLLLNHYQIKKPLLVLNDFNESKTHQNILARLKNEEDFALISDAGTPLISDPGYKLVRECLANNIKVDSLPGPVSPIVALTLSGLPPDKFTFLGFLPDKSGHRQKVYDGIKKINEEFKNTYIIFLSPYKFDKTFTELKENFGNINITLAKELTKIYHSVETKKISEWETFYKKQKPKGEYILLLNF